VLYLSGSLAPDVAIDISAEVETKCLAVLAHRSQLGGDEPSWSSAALADRAARVGRRAGVASAEAFRRIRLLS
jgi:LmbE family N-acetylglucosaminyl deacetylase